MLGTGYEQELGREGGLDLGAGMNIQLPPSSVEGGGRGGEGSDCPERPGWGKDKGWDRRPFAAAGGISVMFLLPERGRGVAAACPCPPAEEVWLLPKGGTGQGGGHGGGREPRRDGG